MRLINLLCFIFFSVLIGCVPGTQKAELCPSGQTFDQALRACSGSIVNVNTAAPVNTTSSITVNEDTPSVVYLSYSDSNNDLATSCTISSPQNISAGACTCTAGVCSFTLTPDSNENSSYSGPLTGFKFNYTVTANGDTSAISTVNVTVTPVDDAVFDVATMTSATTLGAASAANLSNRTTLTMLSSTAVPALGTITKVSNSTTQIDFTTTNGENITMASVDVLYLDRDGGNHSIEIINAQNVSATAGTCTTSSITSAFGGAFTQVGALGTCTYYITKSSDYYGPAAIQFRIRSISGVIISSSPTYTVSGTFTAVDDAPIALATSISAQAMTEETEKIITLPYSDTEGDIAVNGTTGCDITAMTNLTESTLCSCSSGICTVGLTPAANAYSDGFTTFSFQYTVTTQSTYPVVATNTSAASTVFSNITVTNVVDNPTGTLAVESTNEDTAKVITLTYTDPDVSSATGTTTSCAVTSLTGGIIGPTCTCTLGVCTSTFTPTADYSGAATFSYTITRGTRTSTAQTVAVTVNAVNDNPTIALATTANTNMNTPIYIPISLDEGGGAVEDTQSLSITSITATNATLIPTTGIYEFASGVETAFADAATDVSAKTWYLKLTPDDNTYGSTSVTVLVSDGAGGTATASITITVNPVFAVHNGWKNIKAVGAKLDHDGSTLEAAYVRLDWEAFDIFGSTIHPTGAYNIYKGVSPNVDWSTPINTSPIPSTQTYYVDTTTLAPDTVYVYAVRPIDETYEKEITPYHSRSTLLTTVYSAESGNTTNYGVVTIQFPHDNMAYLHRWAVNKELCQKMSQTSDANNEFKCAYSGPGSVAGNLYDFNGNAYVDINEMGCNYSRTECGPDGCIGSGNPGTTGCSGSACVATSASITSPILYYDRTNAYCYYTVNNSTWSVINTAFATTYAQYVDLNTGNNPPLTNINAQLAHNICSGRSTSAERLMTRPEFIAAAAWDLTMSDATITARETGANLNSTSACNSSAAAGLAISDDVTLPTTDTDTLPSTTSSTHRTLVTGSTTTSDCRSRYGIQDLVGNVREYNLDTMECTSPTSCQADDGTTDLTIAGFTYTNQWLSNAGIFFEVGNAATMAAGSALTSWQISTKSNSYDNFVIPYGLPITGTAVTYGAAVIDGTSGSVITSAQLHNDMVGFNTAIIDAHISGGVVTSGGSFNNGTQAGRYTMDWVTRTSIDSGTGFRCINKF